LTRITDEKTRALAEIKIMEINNNIFPRDEGMISMAHLFSSLANEIQEDWV
jgi:hypothetical protein